MNIRDEITQRIIIAMEAGTPPWRAGWSSGQLCFNADTGKPYQGINQLLLGMSGYDDPRWLTFKQAKRMKHHVKKGEKSTKIVRLVEVDNKDQDDDNRDTVAEDKDTKLVMRYFDVFNAAQIEGLEPVPPREHAIEPVAAADAVVEGMKATGLMVLHGARSACYSPHMDSVRMPAKADFLSTEDYYSTLLHECAHATGAPKRLNRLNLTARFGSVDYAKEELRAEISSAMMSAELGIPLGPSHIENHAAYVASWLQALRDDKNEIFRAAGAAQGICDYLCEHAIEPKPLSHTATVPSHQTVPVFAIGSTLRMR